jgi:hypothetical protein
MTISVTMLRDNYDSLLKLLGVFKDWYIKKDYKKSAVTVIAI